jgi:CHASE3 domain sensor protein
MSVTSGPRAAVRTAPVGPPGIPAGPPGTSTNLTAGLRRTAGTTPGRLGMAMVGLVVLSVLTGVIALLSIQSRADTLSDLTSHREPVSAAAQQIYRSLSDADATAASAFLTSAVEPPALRARYQADIAQAGTALAVAATDISGIPEATKPLSELATGIPVYTGLVERAATNNAQGYPVGSAYLREADHLMQSGLLPAAQALYAIDTQRLIAAQDDATSFPWFAALLGIALLVALIFTQRYLRRRTNRVINVGLLIATVAVVVAMLWSATGMILQTVHVDHGRSAGSDPAELLAQARTKALQARTDEMLTLVARGGQNYDKPYHSLTSDIGGSDGGGGLLGQVHAGSSDDTMTSQIGAAITAAKSWFALHDQATTANSSGDFKTAVAITLGSGAKGTPDEAAAFDKVDSALNQAIGQARIDFADQTGIASSWLTALPIGVLVLLVLAAFGAAVGIWQRLREYR